MSNNEPQSFYSHRNATVTGTGAWIDIIAFTEDSSIQISIDGDALVLLEGSLDILNPALVVDCSQGGTVDTVWWRLPKEVMFVRTNIVSGTPGFSVSSCVSRGISSMTSRPTSAQAPVLLSASTG